jgi:hypothetical protein
MATANPQSVTPDTFIHTAGRFAIASGIIASIGVVFLIAMFVFFATPLKSLGATFGMVNDICIAIQYLLAIPIALALRQILLPYNPTLIRVATVEGIVMMLVVVGLQLALVFGLLPFEKQVVWVTLAMLVGIGAWLVITGLVARSSGRFPNSLLMSSLAVPYVGFPLWAFWLAQHLLTW